MKISLAKLKAILLYFGTYTDPKFLGKVKLMKLFYFLDFMHVKKYGAPVTYDTYINLEHGPIPSTIKNLIDTAEEDADNSVLTDTIKLEKDVEENIHRIIPLRKFNEADKKHFSSAELAVLALVIKRFGDKNTKYIEDASHLEAPWKETSFLDTIPYSLATLDDDCLTSKEEIDLMITL